VVAARAAVQTIRDNLAYTRLSEGATVQQTDAFRFLRETSAPPFDIIFVAPPQYKELWSAALTAIDAAADRYLSVEGQVVVQIDPREFRETPLHHLALSDKRRYGNTLLCFYERPATLV